MSMVDLHATQAAMQRLAEWHEGRRDSLGYHQPRDENGIAANVDLHNRAASECYNAAIAIGVLISKLKDE